MHIATLNGVVPFYKKSSTQHAKFAHYDAKCSLIYAILARSAIITFQEKFPLTQQLPRKMQSLFISKSTIIFKEFKFLSTRNLAYSMQHFSFVYAYS